MTTIIVSPIARDIANKIALTIPGNAAGRITCVIVSACVAPSADAPSRRFCGTELITSSERDEITSSVKPDDPSITLNKKEDDSENIEKTVKKRGRKPKIKTENNEENGSPTEVVEKVLKKRGRKPKNKTEPEVQKIPKKRGRKPKEKIYSVKELPKTFYEENKNETLILHLPIQEDEENNDPQPLEQDNQHLNLYDNNKIENIENLPTQIDFLKDNIEKVEEKLESEIKETNEWSKNSIHSNKVIKKNLRNILYEFIDFNKNEIHCTTHEKP